jgi:hypothetical protein
MKLESFEREYFAHDSNDIQIEIWSGASLKTGFYKNIGVDPEKDKIYYLRITTRGIKEEPERKELYRFTYNDQIKLLDLVLNNKQLEKPKIQYGLKMIEYILSWLPPIDSWDYWNKEKLKKVLEKARGDNVRQNL